MKYKNARPVEPVKKEVRLPIINRGMSEEEIRAALVADNRQWEKMLERQRLAARAKRT